MFRKLNCDGVNLVALATVGGVFVVAYQMHLSKTDAQTLSWLLSIALTLSFFAALFNFW